jgi:hypothetical protein
VEQRHILSILYVISRIPQTNLFFDMKSYRRFLLAGVMVSIIVMLQGCQLVADIFGAGLWAGVILTLLVLGLIIWLIAKVFRRR